jgi:hypothetical protein
LDVGHDQLSGLRDILHVNAGGPAFPPAVLAIASPSPDCGKNQFLRILAAGLGHRGFRVLIVDLDQMALSIHRLQNLLNLEVVPADLLQVSDTNVWVLPLADLVDECGGHRSRFEQLGDVFEQERWNFDLILVNLPPGGRPVSRNLPALLVLSDLPDMADKGGWWLEAAFRKHPDRQISIGVNGESRPALDLFLTLDRRVGAQGGAGIQYLGFINNSLINWDEGDVVVSGELRLVLKRLGEWMPEAGADVSMGFRNGIRNEKPGKFEGFWKALLSEVMHGCARGDSEIPRAREKLGQESEIGIQP